MSKLTQARAGVPGALPGAVAPLPGRPSVIKPATALFFAQGARAAHDFLGGGLRAKLLMPKVFARAKYLERHAKHLNLPTEQPEETA